MSGIYNGSALITGSVEIYLIILYLLIELIRRLSPPSGKLSFLNTFTTTPTLYISSIVGFFISLASSCIYKLSPKKPSFSAIALFTALA